MKYQELVEKKHTTEKIFSGHLLELYKDTVILPDGKQAPREYVKHVGAVCVVPITDDGRVIVERQYRYPVEEVTLEIPAGKLNSKQEDHEEAARRELREETGAIARELIYLGKFYPTCAYSDEIIYMYMAKGLDFTDASPDDDEFLTVESLPIDELVSMINNGEVPDGKTQAAVLRAYMMLKQ